MIVRPNDKRENIMLFNSVQFLLFFPVVSLIYFAIPHKIKWIWLLLASYYFYMCWNPKYALLMFTSTFITWLSGIAIGKCIEKESVYPPKKIKMLKNITVAVSFISNLSILFFFKYFDFAIDNINHVLSSLNLQLLNPSFDVILPVGISFYTFQALGYTMDVYREELPPEKNLFRYMLFVSFFPQLVAGPIERSTNLLHQLKEKHKFNLDNVKNGLLLMFWGYFQKLVIADRAAIAVNSVYNNYTEFGGVEIAIATVLFALQIYCDFSSYTDIARGAAQVMGFKLMDNFQQPYFSRSIAEFWRKWHISLSGWFKDYLYIPLGGNKKGKIRKYFNIMIVFLTSGLWHGASWNFVIWGALHGAYQIAGDATKTLRERICSVLSIKRTSHAHHFFQRVVTFILVCFGWIFFRANSMDDAVNMIKTLFTNWNPWILTDGSLFAIGLDGYQIFVVLASVLVLFSVSCVHYYGRNLRSAIMGTNIFARWTIIFVMIFAILIFGIYGPGYDESQFIYFQF